MSTEMSYAGARSAFRHQGVARRLVTEFKFGGQPVLGRLMADLARPAFAGQALSIGLPHELLVTWVPSHRAVQRQRGYNQAEVLARALAARAGQLPIAGLVRKAMLTRHQ